VVLDWVNDTRLLVGRGETGVTGNVYCGLHDFSDMSFVLHFLRPDDLFFDVGANSGSYTILAAGGIGCEAIAIEPIPKSFKRLADNVALNCLDSRVRCLNIGVGLEAGQLRFSTAQDTMNHVLAALEPDDAGVTVPVRSLDDIAPRDRMIFMKIDVEGYESNVIGGASDLLKSGSVKGVLMELNGSGSRYGFDERGLHARMLELGFSPCVYFPFDRKLQELSGINVSGNTLYLRDLEFVRQRLAASPKFRILDQDI
jgi:FkbM family methyltransferase